MVRWILGLSLLLLPGGCRCDRGAQEAASSLQESDVASEEVADGSCGVDPEVRRARRKAQVAREAEEARVRSLQVAAADRDAASTAEIDALRKRNRACAERSGERDPACVAFVSGTPLPCEAASGEEKENCVVMSQLGRAIRGKDASVCAALPERGFRRVCEGAITGSFECSERGGDSMGRACRALAASDPDAVCSEGGMDRWACNVVRLVQAIRAEDAGRCASIPGADARRLCAGWFDEGEACRPPVGSSDPRCREVLLSPRQESTASKDEWVLRYINLFSEDASCRVAIHHPEDGAVLTTVDLGVLEGGRGLQERSVSLPQESGDAIRVEATCRWESP